MKSFREAGVWNSSLLNEACHFTLHPISHPLVLRHAPTFYVPSLFAKHVFMRPEPRMPSAFAVASLENDYTGWRFTGGLKVIYHILKVCIQ